MTNFKRSFCSAASYFGTICIFCEVRDNTCNTKGLRCDDRRLDLNLHLLYRKITAHHLIRVVRRWCIRAILVLFQNLHTFICTLSSKLYNRILYHIRQLAGIQLAGGAGGGQRLHKLLVERYICDKAHFLPLPGQKLQRGNAKGRIAACSRYGKLLTNDTIDIHDSHPILLCYITKRIDNKWKLL